MKLSKNNKIIYFILCVITTSLLDLYSSGYIIENQQSFQQNCFSKFIEFTYYENTGAAFSILENTTLLLILIGFFSIIAITYLLLKHIDKAKTFDCFLIAMLFSGILCNTYERITLGFVRDYFQLKTVYFPVFNISDILINISVLAIIVVTIKYNKKKSNNE